MNVNNRGAFNNQTSWLPDKTSKLEGRRDYMIAKSNARNDVKKIKKIDVGAVDNKRKVMETIE